ncbi:uncharacterized protein LOC116208286 isoform X2 [Punica granatum]|nr:uncharacterized protein LOC116208286 isoform X2 [Punica granatum]XP_031397499.1 uncharacterized protein LOC116208286 isoform X2 [Punica granatum]XP_031397500.1 uncharacterized protein LOC116208286 isoform X2 [Punica granatum]
MEMNGRISKYRDRLDKTLASPDLTNPETLKSLIRKHLLSTTINGVEECSEALLERRTSEVSNFLEMLRSASGKSDGQKAGEKSHAEWKLKQDNEEFRVMYREGPPGSPFHTMLVEGYIDGTIDACLCVSWESNLYKKWWPQYTVPTFKVVSSECLHKIRIGDQISLLRVKVSWPLSAREALVQLFEFEYFQDDLIIVLLNTINESESIDRRTHGYSRDMIPQAKDVVRIGAVGGFALQKVNSGRSYFRTISNVDLKLDFVPPSLINFISRQLIGSGFRLYQKAIASVFNSDGDFKKALGDPLYDRIREALYRTDEQNLKLEGEGPKTNASDNEQKTRVVEVIQEHTEETSEETHTIEVVEQGMEEKNQEIHVDQNEGESTSHGMTAQSRTTYCEIEEEGMEDSRREEVRSHDTNKRKVYISPEVEQALGTLEKVIALVREHGWNAYSRPSSNEEEPEYHEEAEVEKSTPADWRTSLGDQVAIEVQNKEKTGEIYSDEPRNSSSSHSLRSKKSNSLREVTHNKVAPASPVENLVVPGQINQVTLYSIEKGKAEGPDHVLNDPVIIGEEIKENDTDGGKKSRNRRRKYRLCCFHPSSRQSMI